MCVPNPSVTMTVRSHPCQLCVSQEAWVGSPGCISVCIRGGAAAREVILLLAAVGSTSEPVGPFATPSSA